MPQVDGLEMLARLKRAGERPEDPGRLHQRMRLRLGRSTPRVRVGRDRLHRQRSTGIVRAKVKALVTLFLKSGEIERKDWDIAAREQEAKRARVKANTAVVQAARAELAVLEKDRYIGVLGHDFEIRYLRSSWVCALQQSPNLAVAERNKVARCRAARTAWRR